jgi:hypothetical protein
VASGEKSVAWQSFFVILPCPIGSLLIFPSDFDPPLHGLMRVQIAIHRGHDTAIGFEARDLHPGSLEGYRDRGSTIL